MYRILGYSQSISTTPDLRYEINISGLSSYPDLNISQIFDPPISGYIVKLTQLIETRRFLLHSWFFSEPLNALIVVGPGAWIKVVLAVCWLYVELTYWLCDKRKHLNPNPVHLSLNIWEILKPLSPQTRHEIIRIPWVVKSWKWPLSQHYQGAPGAHRVPG